MAWLLGGIILYCKTKVYYTYHSIKLNNIYYLLFVKQRVKPLKAIFVCNNELLSLKLRYQN